MARGPDSRVEQAREMFLSGKKLIEIAEALEIPEGTVRSWKNRYKWSNATLQKEKRNVAKVAKKRGGQPGNQNAKGHGAPKQNKNAETHGFFSKYLPEETFSIIQEINKKDPLDILWENIEIAYAAIVRAQRIAYVKDSKDNTIIKSGYKDGKVIGEDYLVQTAIDKQSKFMQAQARAQGELRSLIKQYDEMLHKNWDLATEEQKARIAKLKVDVEKDEDKDKPIKIQFVKASEKHG